MIQRENLSKKSVVNPKATDQDNEKLEATLRPANLAEFVGQEEIKKNLEIFFKAAKKRNEPLDHALFHGPAGLGKTSLAFILAKEMGVSIKVTSGPAIEKQGDLAAILTNMEENGIFFIDEIHRLKPVIEEVLYTAMEDFGFDIVLGKGPSARSVRLTLPRFTLVGATTKVSLLSSPLRDRFGAVFKLNFYEETDIEKIVLRSARILQCDIERDAAARLAKSSRKTPRIANRLLRRVRDFKDVDGRATINKEIVEKTLEALGVDNFGLDDMDRRILKTVIEKFKGGPVGLNTLSSALSEEEMTIEEIYEPYLMQLGFLERTARGRMVTERAYKHLDINLFTS